MHYRKTTGQCVYPCTYIVFLFTCCHNDSWYSLAPISSTVTQGAYRDQKPVKSDGCFQLTVFSRSGLANLDETLLTFHAPLPHTLRDDVFQIPAINCLSSCRNYEWDCKNVDGVIIKHTLHGQIQQQNAKCKNIRSTEHCSPQTVDTTYKHNIQLACCRVCLQQWSRHGDKWSIKQLHSIMYNSWGWNVSCCEIFVQRNGGCVWNYCIRRTLKTLLIS